MSETVMLGRSEQVELSKMVKAECANYIRGKCCFRGDGVCPVLLGKKCTVPLAFLAFAKGSIDTDADYFGGAVAPLAKKEPKYAEAASAYAKITSTRAFKTRTCECGAILASAKRTCDKCIKKNAALRQRKWRASA